MTDDETASAMALIRLHGENAAAEAMLMAEKMMARKDEPGYGIWMRIVRTIRDTQHGETHAG